MRRTPEPLPPSQLDSMPGDALVQGGGGPVAGDEFQVRDYLTMLFRRRWLILSVVLVAVLGSVYYNATATRWFEAWATLQIEADPNVLGLDRPLVDQRDWMREYLPTQFRVLESRELARLAREEMRARLADAGAAGAAPRADTTGAETSEEQGVWVPSVDEIVDGRMIQAVRDTRVVSIGYRSTDPRQAAAVANALAQAYTEWNTASKLETTRVASRWLMEQVEAQRKLVEASEAELQRYRTEHNADALDDRENVINQKLTDLQRSATTARADTVGKEAHFKQLEALQASGTPLDTHPLIAANGYIHALKSELANGQQQLAEASEQLGDLHPDIIRLRGVVANAERKLETELSKVASAIRNEYYAARSREGALNAAVAQQQLEVRELKGKGVEYMALERTAQANRDLLDNLVSRSRQITISRDVPAASARILDAAEAPTMPISPRQERNLLLGLAGGLVLALGLVFLLEASNTRVTSPDDVRRHLRIRVLGIAPDVKALNGHTPLLLGDGAPPQFTELLQGVRTNLVTAPEFATARALLVTSAEPGEGKTMTAANLAVSLARLNQRVLLIDADLRKPRLHQLFGVERKPGLTDVLTGRATHAAFQQTRVGRLWLMPAGDDSSNPTDLLGSERFGQLIDTLRGQFDWVVLDSPPVLAVTDPCLIARVASGVLFVVGSGRTSRDAAAAAVERLDSVGATFVGAMLNRVVLDGSDRSYLSYYRDYPRSDDRQPDSSLAPDVPAPPLEVEVEVESPPPPRPRTRRYTAVADALGESRNPWDI